MTNGDMTNKDVTNADRCPRCGANLALVGRVHRCIAHGSPVNPEQDVARQHEHPGESRSGRKSTGNQSGPSSYRYRDPDKWRAYMRDYMRKRRAS